MKHTMSTSKHLSAEEKAFVVTRLAAFSTPVEVVQHFQERYARPLHRNTVQHYVSRIRERADIEPLGSKARVRPVLYNSWEATGFNVSEAGQKELADKAAKIGVELFVIDDG